MIGHVDYHITNHCNLNCAGCNQFGTLAKPWFVSYEQFCEEWQLVHDKDIKIKEIRILGGETLLHPDLNKLVIFLRSLFPNSSIVVYTNAILLEKRKEEIMPVFNEQKITLFISRYPNLKLDYWDLIRGFSSVQWADESFFMNTCLHRNPDFDPDYSFHHCNSSQVWQCRFLKDNRLYACSMLPNICHLIDYFPELKDTPLGQMKIEDNGIDIREHTVEEIENFLYQTMPACAFCNIAHARQFHPWHLSKYELSEWVEQ